MTPTDLRAVLDLLPAPVSEIEQLGGPGRPWAVRYGARRAVLRRNDPGRFRAFGQSAEVAVASIAWLHEVLRDLAQLGFTAPVPISDLGGQSIAMVDGDLGAADPRPRTADGLERRRDARGGRAARALPPVVARLPQRPQRPGAHPVSTCRPEHPAAHAVWKAFRRELEDIGHDSARGVIHGDATQSNVVIDDGGNYGLVDFAIAYEDVLLADVGSALWRNGRASPNAVTYDAARAATFVRGYVTARPLPPSAGRAIVVYMKGRGLQLQWRLELRNGNDETVIQRMLSIEAQQAELEAAITAALDGPRQ